MDIPINISVLNEEFLKATGATTLTEVLNFAGSGVNQRVSYREDPSIRGFREAVNRDGIAFTSYGWGGLYDVDRIEIIKGPTALVYGNFGSIGGTVNYITKRPTAKSQGDAHLTVGTDGLYGADVTQRGPITREGGVRYRVTAGLQQYDGYKQSEYENNRMVSGSVDWSATKQVEVQFNFARVYSKRGDFNRSLVDPITLTLAKFPAEFSTSADWSKVYSENDRFRLNVIYQPTHNLTVRLLADSFQNDYGYFVPQPTPGLRAAEAPNYRTIGQRLLKFDLQDWVHDEQADVTWTATFGKVKNRLNAGWANRYSDNTQTLAAGVLPAIEIAAPFSSRPTPPAPSTYTYLSQNAQGRSSGWTTYIQDAVTLFNDHLILTGGLRWIPSGATTKGVETNVPRYGVIYKVNSGLSVYAAYAEAFTPRTGLDILGRPFVDTYGKNKEVGVKLNAFEGRVFGSIAYFDILNDPVVTQVQVVDPRTGLEVYGNVQVGEQTAKGVEADVGTLLDIGPGQLLAYGTYYDADPLDERGLKPARVVAKKATVFGRYDFKRAPLSGFGIGGGISYFGEQLGTGIPVQPGYTIYSAIIGYRAKQWSVNVNLDNLTDKKNAIVGSEANFSVYTARPFSAKATFSYNW